MSSVDDTVKLADKLHIRLRRYRARHEGRDPKWIEVNPIAFPALLSELKLPASGTDLRMPTVDGVPLWPAGSGNAALFAFVDP